MCMYVCICMYVCMEVIGYHTNDKLYVVSVLVNFGTDLNKKVAALGQIRALSSTIKYRVVSYILPVSRVCTYTHDTL